MTPDKTTPAAATSKPDATTKHTVGSAPVYVGTERYDPGATVELTASQATRLGAAVTAAKAA